MIPIIPGPGNGEQANYPPGVEFLPHLTRSRIPEDASSAAIDAMVAEQGGSLYELDAEVLAALRPELILTQEQCDVCAVNEATVRRMAASLPGNPTVESVNPTDLESLFTMFRRVGRLLQASDTAESLIARFHETADRIARRVEAEPVSRVLILEWVDPPYSSGHWNPEIIALAGGREVIGRAGERSRRLDWEEVAAADPEVILVAACGYSIDRAEADLEALSPHRPWQDIRAVRNARVAVTDGSAYFSRPGPRLETSLRIAAAAIHPETCGDLAPPGSLRFLPARV